MVFAPGAVRPDWRGGHIVFALSSAQRLCAFEATGHCHPCLGVELHHSVFCQPARAGRQPVSPWLLGRGFYAHAALGASRLVSKYLEKYARRSGWIGNVLVPRGFVDTDWVGRTVAAQLAVRRTVRAATGCDAGSCGAGKISLCRAHYPVC